MEAYEWQRGPAQHACTFASDPDQDHMLHKDPVLMQSQLA